MKDRKVNCRQKMRHAPIEIGALEKNERNATTVISSLARCGEVGLAWDVFVALEKISPPSKFTYSAMVSACEKARDWPEWERALVLMSEMVERGIEPDVFNYSATISACEKSAQW